jgi:hypothetical protein
LAGNWQSTAFRGIVNPQKAHKSSNSTETPEGSTPADGTKKAQ